MGRPRNSRPQLTRDSLGRNGVKPDMLAPFLTIGLALSAACTTHQSDNPAGSYVLEAAGSREVPFMVSRLVPGEGTTLHSAHLDLLPTGILAGQIVVSFTDSGTVTDTLLVEGRWFSESDTVRIEYQWSIPRWQGGPRAFRSGERLAGRILGSDITLPRLAYLDETFFGGRTPLRFRRVPMPLRPN